jgi:hypothetical protein
MLYEHPKSGGASPGFPLIARVRTTIQSPKGAGNQLAQKRLTSKGNAKWQLSKHHHDARRL